jgi:hypothetical protein
LSENETHHAVMRSNDGFRKASTQPTAHIGLLLCGVVSAKHFGVALILPSVDSATVRLARSSALRSQPSVSGASMTAILVLVIVLALGYGA